MSQKQGQTTFSRTSLAALAAALLSACSGGPVPPDWELNAVDAMRGFQTQYLRGNAKAAELEFARVRGEISSTGRPDLLARAELARCAVRAASLEFDDCPGFETLRRDAGAEELAYADYLSGKSERSPTQDAVSKLVSYGVKFKAGRITPAEITAAVDLSSAQGWRRPLLAWLGVLEKRAEAAGDRAALERIRRRILITLEKN